MSARFRLHPDVTFRQLTGGGGHCFFGYFDKSPWDASGRRILGMRAPFWDRPPGPDDELELFVLEPPGTARTFARTKAWNWQQGCMLQWLAGGGNDEVIFNDREGGRFVSLIHNVRSGRTRTLDLPVYAVDPAGRLAVTTSFPRLHHQRPGYGYAGIEDPWRDVAAPDGDGIFSIDLENGRTKMLLSLAQAAGHQPSPDYSGRVHRFNHLQYSRDGSRFIFLHRYKNADEPVGITRMFTLGRDGDALRLLSDHGMVSHFDWRGSSAVLAWAHRRGEGDRFFVFPDGEGEISVLGRDILDCDGHCSFSPDGQWLLTDSYPDAEDFRTLILFRPSDGFRADLGRFFSPPGDWEIRCDLHPRWSPDGRSVCIDSAHEGIRHMYALSVDPILQTPLRL